MISPRGSLSKSTPLFTIRKSYHFAIKKSTIKYPAKLWHTRAFHIDKTHLPKDKENSII